MSSSFIGNVVKDNEVTLKVKAPFDLVIDSNDNTSLKDKLNAISKGQVIKKIGGDTPSFIMEPDIWFNATSEVIDNITVTADTTIEDKIITAKLAFSLSQGISLESGWLKGDTNTIIKWQYDEPLPNSNGVIYIVSLSQVITAAATTENSVIFANLESIIPLSDTVTPTGTFGLAPNDYAFISNKGERIIKINGTAPNIIMKHDTVYSIDASSIEAGISYDLSHLVTTPFIDDINNDLTYTATSEIWIKTGENIPTIEWGDDKIWLYELNPQQAPTLSPNKSYCFVVRRINESEMLINLAYTV